MCLPSFSSLVLSQSPCPPPTSPSPPVSPVALPFFLPSSPHFTKRGSWNGRVVLVADKSIMSWGQCKRGLKPEAGHRAGVQDGGTSLGRCVSTHLRVGRISEFSPGSCFPNWLQGKPRMTRPNGSSSSCSAFSSGPGRERRGVTW